TNASTDRSKPMSSIMTILQILLLCIEAVLAAMIAYLVLLTAVAWFAPRRTPPRTAGPTNRFLILVPAHNEEQLIPSLLANLQQLDYPPSLYSIHVVADTCTDRTAELACQGGAGVHERIDSVRRGKGYALQWLIE